MNFEQWLTANGYDAAALTATQRKHLESAWRADTAPPPVAATPPLAIPVQAPAPAPASTFDQTMAAIEAENQRVLYIQERTTAVAQQYIGHPEKLRQLRELCTNATADKKINPQAFDLALLRLDRSIGNISFVPRQDQETNAKVLEAAVCMATKLPGVEKQFSDRVLQTAHSRFRRGLGLQELFMIAAERNGGYRGSSRDYAAVCKAAFRPQQDAWDLRAEGPSTIAVPGILSNIANKFLAAGFLYTEQSWRQVAKIRSANDFKTMTTYRLGGANKFVKVAPGGEIKHGTLSELTYTNKVDTYGIMLGIDRRDYRNDDLGAFTGAADEIGRGGGDSLNEIFWTDFLNDSAFFNTDKSKNNYDDGATDSVLSLAGLDNAETIFRKQTKADGTPLGIMPMILLVPAELTNTALQLMGSQGLAVGTTPATGPDRNVFYGRYRTVSSVYLSNSNITGYSTTAWYLLADPNNVPVIEVAFLDGVETPIVETGEFDFDRLGMSMRAYMDYGSSKQEYRGGTKLKGAA